MNKFLCIHGHFYQPPRENPWLETVEVQDSAAPFHDWNERITAECYGRNAAARLLDHDRKIRAIVNNYSKISFNFGPTLLTWMKEKMPWVHDAIVQADKESQKNFSGHGSALAQVYNHIIMPLANERDKKTQVIWGMRDFESRFGRKPEGMWLAETAADTETLEVLAEHGIKFTILSPFQASKVRQGEAGEWQDVNGGKIDPARPYLARLPSGRTITLFFYDAPVSQGIAFEKLLDSGEKFAGRLLSAFSDAREGDQFVHVGTDGESYGHHHRYGEMALAYAIENIESNKLARITIYGEYLEAHEPEWEVMIHEKSAWSCSHGVGRWMEDCGCNSGGHAGWNQGWRGPLREALDWLRDSVTRAFEERGKALLKNPWAARDDYISVMLDRTDESVEGFLKRHAVKELTEEDKIAVLKLMELQRHALLMYTSCGWFFDELSGIETVQVVQYAARVIQLAEDVLGLQVEEGFLQKLEKARSNIVEHCDGRCIYNKFIKPAMISWDNVVAHFAISSIFTPYEETTRIFLYSFQEEHRKVLTSGRARLVYGKTRVRFDITRETRRFSYAALYLGEHHVTAGVKAVGDDDENFSGAMRALRDTFDVGDFPETIRLLDRHFGSASYGLRSLFKDEQRRILNDVLSSTREDLENRFRLISERYTPLVKFLTELGTPLPPELQTPTDWILHRDVVQLLKAENPDLERLNALLEEARMRHVDVFDNETSLVIATRLSQLLQQIEAEPEKVENIRPAVAFAHLARSLEQELNFWRTRTRFWDLRGSLQPEMRKRAQEGDEVAKEWLKEFEALGDELGFRRVE